MLFCYFHNAISSCVTLRFNIRLVKAMFHFHATLYPSSNVVTTLCHFITRLATISSYKSIKDLIFHDTRAKH